MEIVRHYEWVVPRFVVLCHILGKEEEITNLSAYGGLARVFESSLFEIFGLFYNTRNRRFLNKFFIDLFNKRPVHPKILEKVLTWVSEEDLKRVYVKGSGITSALKSDMGLFEYCELVYSDLLGKHASDMRDFLTRTGIGTFERSGERMVLSLEGSDCDFEDVLWSASKFDCGGKVVTMVPIIL